MPLRQTQYEGMSAVRVLQELPSVSYWAKRMRMGFLLTHGVGDVEAILDKDVFVRKRAEILTLS